MLRWRRVEFRPLVGTNDNEERELIYRTARECPGDGLSLKRAGRLGDAARAYKRSADVDSRNNLGVLFEEQGRYSAAIAQYSRALLRDASHLQARCNRADLYVQLGRYDAAINEYRLAPRLDDDAQRNLEVALQATGRTFEEEVTRDSIGLPETCTYAEAMKYFPRTERKITIPPEKTLGVDSYYEAATQDPDHLPRLDYYELTDSITATVVPPSSPTDASLSPTAAPHPPPTRRSRSKHVPVLVSCVTT